MNVIVTGANSGFGRLTVETLARAGHTVFACVRGSTEKNAVATAELTACGASLGGRIAVVDMDVTSEASVLAAVTHVAGVTGGAIDVVVNNAGQFSMGITESFTVAQVQALFDVNVFGPLRVNRAVLPYMRARKSGLLVQISSILGRLALPFMGPYAATKFATEALAEAWQGELKDLGVDSVVIEPGAYPTNVGANAQVPADADIAEAYGDAAKKPQAMGEGLGQLFASPQAPKPQDVADAILALVGTPFGQRPLRTVVDNLSGDPVRSQNAHYAQCGAQLRAAFGL